MGPQNRPSPRWARQNIRQGAPGPGLAGPFPTQQSFRPRGKHYWFNPQIRQMRGGPMP